MCVFLEFPGILVKLLDGESKATEVLLQTITSQTRDTSVFAGPQETDWGVLRNHVGNSKLGCHRDPAPPPPGSSEKNKTGYFFSNQTV